MRWVFFPLHPDTPAEGQSLDVLFTGRHLDLQAMQQRLADLMRAEGLPYGERTHTYNSRLAQELGKWADTRGVEAIHDVLYRAYFVDNRNISDLDELIRLAQSVGLPHRLHLRVPHSSAERILDSEQAFVHLTQSDGAVVDIPDAVPDLFEANVLSFEQM